MFHLECEAYLQAEKVQLALFGYLGNIFSCGGVSEVFVRAF